MTQERWAQVGITIQFLIVIKTLGEIFRLRPVNGAMSAEVVILLVQDCNDRLVVAHFEDSADGPEIAPVNS